MIGRRQVDILAYVDGCLAPAEAGEIEDLAHAQPDIARQIDEWRRQSEAIRAAFASPAPHEEPAGPARGLANENASGWMPQGVRTLRRNIAARPTLRLAPRAAAEATAAVQKRRPLFIPSILLRAVVVLAALMATAAQPTRIPPGAASAAAGVAAFRTLANGIAAPVEHSTGDAADLQKWFGRQFDRATPVPDLSRFGLRLLGGRVIPGAEVAAAFLLYEDGRHQRIGLAIEPEDAPRPASLRTLKLDGVSAAYWPGAGHAFTLIGRDGLALGEIARVAFLE